MANKFLVKYIRENIDKGYSISDLRKAIIEQGYSTQEAEEAINEATQVQIERKHGIKKLPIIIVAVVIISIVAFFLMYNPPPLYSTAASVFNDAYSRFSGLQSYKLDFQTTIVYILGEDQNSLVITGEDYKKQDNYKTVIYGPELETINIYNLGGSTYLCFEDSCNEADYGIDTFKPSQSFYPNTKDLMDKGIIEMEHMGTKSIAGRPCNSLKIKYDVDRIISEDYEDSFPGLKDIVDITGEEPRVDMSSTACFDQETGVIMEYISTLNMTAESLEGDEYTVFLSTRVTTENLQVNPALDDSEFTIPTA